MSRGVAKRGVAAKTGANLGAGAKHGCVLDRLSVILGALVHRSMGRGLITCGTKDVVIAEFGGLLPCSCLLVNCLATLSCELHSLGVDC